MFRNYLNSAVRNLSRFKLFTFLNVFGLATGMACSILILLWVQDERSYDKFNTNASHIYRLTTNLAGSEDAVTPPPVVEVMKQQMPEVKNYTRLVPLSTTVSVGNKKFVEKKVFYADANFLQLFNYPLLQGDKLTVLNRPEGVVITAATAIKYFGNANPVGKILHVDNDVNGNNYVVTGVLKNIPHNSHLQFDILLPISFYNKSNGNVWDNYSVYSYIQLSDSFNTNPAAISRLEKQINNIYTVNDNTHTKAAFSLQRLTDIHLHSHFLLDVEGQGSNQSVTIFSLVAVFILLIACINFMNLSTALGAQRAKEVGLRKTIGAVRSQIITQFLSESLIVALLSLVIGIGIARLCLPLFNEVSAKAISFDLSNIRVIEELLLLAVIVGVVSGSYPAFFMSSFNPVAVLKGLKIINGQKSVLRSGLVILQFSISVVLIVGTLVVNKQLKFIQNRDIGFNKQNLLYLQMPQTGDLQHNYEALKGILQENTGTANYTIIDHLPTNLSTGTTDVTWSGKDPNKQVLFPQIGVDGSFIKIFGMHMLTGRPFNDDSKMDESNYILNETAVRIMGMTPSSAIGQVVNNKGHQGVIIGVVKDFNFKPVQQLIEPLILKHTNRGGFVVLRTSPANIKLVINKLKSVFQDVYHNYPFSYGFVDEDLSKMYVTENRVGILFNSFSAVSIIISCLGLFGLATFTTQRRLKEIGIRRILGANALGVISMLAKDFVKLIVLALIIAFPVSWWVMNSWLNNYVYHIAINWPTFAVAGTTALVIALLTIAYQSVNAALSNPVKSLRNE